MLARSMRWCVFAVACACATVPLDARAYGWLGHWRVAESQWDNLIRKLCPAEQKLEKISPAWAAYLAGLGAALSDIGYFPGGPRQFSDLVHYIGTGVFTDKVTELACQAKDPQMLAFAAGMRSHYWADLVGHAQGTNPAVALVSGKSKFGATRMVYEDDERTHKILELGTFQAADLSYGTTRLAVAFVQNAGEIPSVVFQLLINALTLTYGPAGAAMAPTSAQMAVYTLFVAKMVCEVAVEVYDLKVTANPGLMDLRAACNKRGEIRVQVDAETQSLMLEGIKYFKQKSQIDQLYEASVKRVESALAGHGGQLPNFNLDTALPSASGQYRTADAVYRNLKAMVAQAKCDGTLFSEAVSKRSDWRGYQSSGACANEAVRKIAVSAKCADVLAAPDLAQVRWGWLRGIGPVKEPKVGGCEPRTIQVMDTKFKVTANCSVATDRPVSKIRLLYACYGALGLKTEGGSLSAAASEATDRLRADDVVDPKTVLLK